MTRRVILNGSLALILGLLLDTTTATALPPLTDLIPFKRIEADPDKTYSLSKDNGPWMILACSFAGPTANDQADALVLELRRRFKLPAYVHRRSYDFTESVVGKGIDKYGDAKRMKHRQAVKFEEIAVLVGDFASIDDPAVAKTLQKLKYAHPECLDISKHKQSTQRFVGLRNFYSAVNDDKAKQAKGPMGSAFATRNPLLPKEFFTAGGLDPFVADMNRGVEYSLLDNPGLYSVRVASFRGVTSLEPEEELRDGASPSNKLELAAQKAHQLTMALRQQGIEAYEFHDRSESIVTVGSFNSVGDRRGDGRIEIDPRIHRIMTMYSPQRLSLPGAPGAALQPRRLNGIPFDLQPIPVAVPRTSVGAEYARNTR